MSPIQGLIYCFDLAQGLRYLAIRPSPSGANLNRYLRCKVKKAPLGQQIDSLSKNQIMSFFIASS
jgi:hypothetical protein